MIVTDDLMARLEKELEFEVPKYYPELQSWFMKGKPDPTNHNATMYNALCSDFLGDQEMRKEMLLAYYKRVHEVQ